MRVLLIANDLYGDEGGGQTVYRKLISANPEIEFVYFRSSESADARRPSNTSAVPFGSPKPLQVAQPFFPQTYLHLLQVANAYARSVAGQEFDVVEFPDWVAFGSFLRDCLEAHHVKFGALVLAMHGNISVAIELGWDAAGQDVFSLRQLEYDQFVGADARYAISRRYMAEWQAKAALDIHYVDPLSIVGLPEPVSWKAERGAPELYCVGRMERRKGNDLFVELLRWVDPALYGRACHVGSTEFTRNGVSSEQVLREFARARDLRVDFLPPQDKADLASIYSRNALVVLPVRYDSLNLVAIEALFSGCPVVVSSAAGVCDYLDADLPGVPYVKIDMANFYGAAAEIERILRDYDSYRRNLLDRLAELRLLVPAPDLRPIYDAALAHAQNMRMQGKSRRSLSFVERGESIRGSALAAARKLVPNRVRQLAKRLLRDPKGAAAGVLIRFELFNDAKLAWYAVSSLQLRSRFKAINRYVEGNLGNIEKKVRMIHEIASSPVYRCNVWRELARLERLRGNELAAVSYELRLLRLLGGDLFGQLPRIRESLKSNGFPQEALAAEALYGSPAVANQRVYEYLAAAFQRCLDDPQKGWEVFDDRRRGAPKVCVIVSLYNAAPKLKLFLTALARQTLVQKGGVEIVLVDSGSKTNEYQVAREFLAYHPLDVAYGRSEQRETIQAAWNRGIHLARAPYLVFLGVDETLYPEALETLADELDRNPSVDWAMANSLVSAVNSQGVLERDVMPYDRTGGTKDHTYLETCYLSWVGGMYRKSIHERFGYYDETFRAAGDTEFKNRVLPYINVRFVPRTLGLFLNYPDERTTASPVAEIEDSRAWYLHRTPGGVRYAFENRDPADALALSFAALGYRKSYCRHTSSDIEYGGHLLDYARRAGAGTQFNSLPQDLARLLVSFRQLEWTESYFSTLAPGRQLVRTWREARRDERAHAALLSGRAAPNYKVLNDNRFEQHSWLWDTA